MMSLMKLPLYCLLCNRTACHSISRMMVRRPCFTTNVRYASYKQIYYGVKKNQRNKILKQKLIVDIRSNMKVKDLARQMQIPLDEILESLEETAGKPVCNKEDDKIESVTLLKQVVRKHGLQFKLKQPDRKAEKMEEELEETPAPKPPDKPGPQSRLQQLQEILGESSDSECKQPVEMKPRTPIVTIMGHVDHGKTTLLDALRESSIVDQEFGGITQHIGAFMVKLGTGETITFLDTPGHAAFSAMRSRGASVTDIIVLVVAADDSVMNQTVESIQHAKQANVPLIVAINKIDKHGADVERTKQELAKHGVIVEEFGGDVQVVPISALKRTNLELLQECITMQAELLDLRADHNARVSGTVIESKTEPGKGRLATVVIKSGTLRVGQFIVAGTSWARVRAMHNEHGQDVEEALPGTPVEVLGWRELPSAGDPFFQASNEREAKTAHIAVVLEERERNLETVRDEIERKRRLDQQQYLSLREEKCKHMLGRFKRRSNTWYMKKFQGIYNNHIELNKRTVPSFPIIVKCDVDGSLDAIMQILGQFNSHMCTLDIMDSGIGDVTEYDIQLAKTFNGQIYAFNVGVSTNTQTPSNAVTIKQFNIIYKMMDDLLESITAILPPRLEEHVIGEATVQKEFTINWKKKKIPVGGCKCTKGLLDIDKNYKVIRDGNVIFTGPLLSLRHHKAEVRQITSGMECGVCLEPDSGVEVKVDDQIVCYEHVEQPQKLDWHPGFT